MPVLRPARFHPRGEAVTDGPHPTRVFGGIPGEEAEVRVLGRGGHVDYGEWVGAAEPSADRISPSCPHYRPCGGCPWMHLGPDAARRWRRALVVDALLDAGLPAEVGAQVEAVVPCPDGDLGYRHLAKLVARGADGGVRLGAFGRNSHDVVDVEGCAVLAPALRAWTELRLPLPDGLLRHVVVRRSRSHGTVLATLVARRDTPELRRVAATLPADGVFLHLNDRPGDAIFAAAGPTERICGVELLEEHVDGVVFGVGPTDFFQTNPSTAARLWADLPRPDGRALLDLYCGVGAVALQLGRSASDVLGIEASPAAVARARQNAARNGIAARFEAGAVGAELPASFAGGLVIVNPPRSGLGPGVAEQVVALRPSELVYVSCDPRTLARDLVRLVAGGLRVRRVTPYDMFPQTVHVETVAVLG
ncbi:MAG: 23S rRNA (uracil(1939)-C(5))-methyltransferase RlmD [Pseudomonadota bacterium]|nr:23S rRNA (uracil(1939)-C(5))-methyltransferase RlmD [Pseudomonadota bacterium]